MEKDTSFVQPSTASHNVNSTVTTTWPPHQSRYPSEPEIFLFLSAAAQIRRYPEKYNHTRSFVQELLGHCDYRDFSIWMIFKALWELDVITWVLEKHSLGHSRGQQLGLQTLIWKSGSKFNKTQVSVHVPNSSLVQGSTRNSMIRNSITGVLQKA